MTKPSDNLKLPRPPLERRKKRAALLEEPQADDENCFQLDHSAGKQAGVPTVTSGRFSNDNQKDQLEQLSADFHHHHHQNESSKRVIQKHQQQQEEQQFKMCAKPEFSLQQHQTRQRRRRKSEISNFLMILFGSIVLLLPVTICLTHQQQRDQSASRRHASNTSDVSDAKQNAPVLATIDDQILVVVSGGGAPPPNTTTRLADDESTTISREEPITKLAQPDFASGGASELIGAQADDEAPDDEQQEGSSERPTTAAVASADDDNDNEPPATDNKLDTGKTKLGELIVDAANSGADLLVDHLRGVAKEEPTPNSNNSYSSWEDGDNGGDNDHDGYNNRTIESSHHQASPWTSAKNSNSNNNINNSHASANNDREELRLAMETYDRWRSASDDIIELFSRKMLPVIVEHGYDVDSMTVTGLLQVFNGIRAIKPWALKLLDASAKLTPGLLVGTQSDFGDFDECLSIRVDDPSGLAINNEFEADIDESTGLKSTTLVGRYCLADVEFPKPPRRRRANRSDELQTDWAPIELRRPLLNFSETASYKETIFVETGNFFHMLYVDPIRVGICLTNKIDPDSFARVFNKLVEEFRITINFKGRCVTKYDKPIWTTYQRVSAYVLATVCLLVIVSTALDLLHTKLSRRPQHSTGYNTSSGGALQMGLRQLASKHRPLFTSFSIIRNTKRLFKAQQSTSAVSINQNRRQVGKQFNLNIAQAAQNGSQQTTTTSSIPDSSVESSPSIERRSSSTDGSAMDLIINDCSNKMGNPIAPTSFNSACTLMTSSSRSNKPNSLLSASGHIIKNNKNTEISLLSLHGIRVITMTWMIVNHTYLFGGFFVLWAHRRLIDIAEWPKSMSFQLVLNGWLTVETYFFLSALIIVLNVLPLMKDHKFSYLSYIIHRLLRLMPAYVGLVCLNFLWPLISSGPVWLVKGKSFIQTPCENYLWTNFLFINNWIWPEKQCMVHTWFLSADFQLYLLAPIVVYLLYRRPALGHSLNLIIAIIASILSGFVIYANKLLPTTLINKLEFDSIKQQLSYSYFATYQHMGPYCLGILTGYLLHKRPRICLPKHLTWLLWLFLPPLSFTTLLLTYLWNGAYDDPGLINPSPLVSALYVAIHRTIWTSLVAWIVFACSTGRAKLLSDFLSNSIFIPLSRLSFSIYLVHLPVIMFRALNLRHTIEWTDTNILWEACGNFIVSLIMGYFLNIAFESPFINLENVIAGRNKGESASEMAPHCVYERNNTTADGARANILDQKSLHRTGSAGETSKTSSTGNDLDDDKSNETSTQEPNSSPEQERKLSDDNLITNGQLGVRASKCNNARWHGQQESSQRSLKPKESSVERIFGQAEPISGYIDGGTTGSLRSDALPNVDLLKKRRFQQQQQQQRQMTPSDRGYQSYSIRDESCGGDIYNISGEYQHYAPGSYQQWRMNNSKRPAQYATLARTNRLVQDTSYLDILDAYPSYYQKRSSLIDREETPRARNHLSEQTYFTTASLRPNQDLSISRHRASQVLSHRRGRYNTLTGTGAKEWRFQHSVERADSEADSWARPFIEPVPINIRERLQAGTMIPRVDSSTLRRQARRPETAESSIIEEPADEENSAL